MIDTAELIARLNLHANRGDGPIDGWPECCDAPEWTCCSKELLRQAAAACACAAQEIGRAHESNRKLAQRNVWFTEAMQACQKLLCPDFGNCEPANDGEKCACGFEGGSFANAIPKNRRAETAEAEKAKAIASIRALRHIGSVMADVEIDNAQLRVTGVIRDRCLDTKAALTVLFSEPIGDAELREFHEYVSKWRV